MTAEVVQPTEEQATVPEGKKFDILNVLAEKVSGTVKWYSVNRHYGFIQRDDNKEDVFVHRTAITASRSRYPTLRTGEPVEFSVVETASGVNAASVTGPNGQKVQGFRFRRYKPLSDSGDGSAKQNGDTNAGGDAEGGRSRGGFRRPRRGRRSFRSNRNGMGDGENAVEGGENSGEGEERVEGGAEGSRAPRQRPRRYRGGPRGGGRGRQRSTSTRQTNGDEAQGAATGDESVGVRRGSGRFRRGGGRGRRGPRGAPRNGDANGEHGENAVSSEQADRGLETQMEKMSLETSEKANGVVEEAPEQVKEGSD